MTFGRMSSAKAPPIKVVPDEEGYVTVCIGNYCVTVACPQAAAKEQLPDPVGTYLTIDPDTVRQYISSLREGEPLCIRHPSGTPVNLSHYILAARTAQDAGHTLLIRVGR